MTSFTKSIHQCTSRMATVLTEAEIARFITDGYIRIDNAFPKSLADAVVDRLWGDIPFTRSDPSSWTEPVIRLGMYSDEPFVQSLNTPKLHNAFDQLIGRQRWMPCRSVGTFPVRFPSDKQPNDTGKHVDASFPGTDETNYMEWRINAKSKGRALLMLVLYSDVTEKDAPTLIYPGSHIEVARLLSKKDDNGLTFIELAEKLEDMPLQERVYATGKAGSIYLCHPFIVHAAQAHNGSNPKFMAQPPLLLKGELEVFENGAAHTPVELAIRLAL